LHEQHGSTLVETYSWQYRKGVLLEGLRRDLEERGVRFRPIPRAALLGDLTGQMVSWLSRLVLAFLNHVKTGGLTSDLLRDRARSRRDHLRCLSFLKLFEAVRGRYERLLGDDLDFHDLINRAVIHLREGQTTPGFRHVLVDEFQDISRGRMALLQALALPNVAWFLVGDDWQSIYRFAGSDVGLVRHCGSYLGHTREQVLSQTFRFGDRILGPSSAFVQRNPEQTTRSLRSSAREHDTGMTIVVAANPSRGVRRALEDIEMLGGGGHRSVLVLGRYRSSREVLPPRRVHRSLKVRFSTVHSAKGEEADYVVVVDLKDDRMGFPCRVEDDPLLDLVLPPLSGKAFPFAEERRLFYVAMTRARIGTYLITDPVRPSSFVTELLTETEDVSQIGEDLAPKCPRCRSGRLIRSLSGKNLRCSNYPTCDCLAPRCGRCKRGYSLVAGKSGPGCTNTACRHRPTNCPRCEIGILMRKTGRYGPFWGCSRYGSEPSCTYTKDVADRRPVP
jgi:DNA helicase-4